MERSITSETGEVAGCNCSIFCHRGQFSHAWGDEFHSAGEHAGGSFGQGQVLISIHADGVSAGLSRSGDGTVTGKTTTTKDRIRTLVHHGVGGLGAPFGIGEGLVKAHIAVVNNEHFSGGSVHAISISGAGFVAFTKAPNGRNHIGTADGADLVACRHHGGEGANKEASIVFGEVQTGNIRGIISGVFGELPGLELIYADEFNIGVGGASGKGCFAETETNGHDYIEASVTKGGDVLGIIFGIRGLNELDQIGHAISLSLLNAFPS